MTATLLGLVLYYSGMYNINPAMVVAIIQTESQFNERALSYTNDRGYMQLNPKSFPQYKADDLYNPEINIREGVKYLAQMRKECSHKLDDTWLICFNLGVNKAKLVKHPKLFPYYRKVKLVMKKNLEEGQKVVVEKMFDLRLPGVGIYRGISQDSYTKGYLRIENEMGHIMLVHPDRVKEEE